jgi:hypothetical protein
MFMLLGAMLFYCSLKVTNLLCRKLQHSSTGNKSIRLPTTNLLGVEPHMSLTVEPHISLTVELHMSLRLKHTFIIFVHMCCGLSLAAGKLYLICRIVIY